MVEAMKSKGLSVWSCWQGPCCGALSSLLPVPLCPASSDFGAVQTFSLTRQIDILCQPRDGAAARDTLAGSSEVGRGWGQGKEAASIWSCLLGQLSALPPPMHPLHTDRCPETLALKVLPPSVPSSQAEHTLLEGAGQWSGRLLNLREAPPPTVTS